MKKEIRNGNYVAPQVDVMTIQSEKVLCISGDCTLEPIDEGEWTW